MPEDSGIISTESAIVAGYLSLDMFDNPWLCPYCAAETSPDDRMCATCERPLLLRQRRSPERSVWLWRGFFLQAYTAFYILAAGLSYFTLILKLKGIPNPLLLLPIYLGLPVDQPDRYAELALATLPMSIFWLLIGSAGYAILLLLILFLRVPFGHLFYILNAGVMFTFGFAGFVISDSWLVWILAGLSLLIGLGQVVITVNLWDDFTFEETRLQLLVDGDARTGDMFYDSAMRYAARQMWAAAALHLRRAIGLRPQEINYHLALTVAYTNMKRLELAQQSLRQVTRLNPYLPEVQKLKQELSALQDRR